MIEMVAALLLSAASWPALHDAIDVHCEDPNTGRPGCVLVRDRSVRCWGPTAGTRPQPTLVAGFADVVALADRCGLTAGGEVRCFNSQNRVLDVGLSHAIDAVGSSEGGCALISDGRVSCWGSPMNCQLGRRPDAPECNTTGWLPPAPVEGLPSIKTLSRGTWRCGLTASGALWCWGGSPLPAPPRDRAGMLQWVRAAQVTGLPPLKSFWAARDLSIGVTTDGRALAWRRASYSQPEQPIRIPDTERLPGIAHAGFGRSFVALVLEDGSGWIWGRDPAVPINDVIPPGERDPLRQIPALTDAVSVSAATEHVCFATREGRVRCLGRNDEGELGNGARLTHPGLKLTDVVEIQPEDVLPPRLASPCRYTEAFNARCIEAGAVCALAAPPGPADCHGGAMRPPSPGSLTSAAASDGEGTAEPLPDCLCSCSREFQRAQRAQREEENRCAQIPARHPHR